MDHQDKAFMNIQVIHEHSVDLDLLPKKATILDLGCRGMEFTNHFRGLGHTVHAVDIDDLQRTDYDRCAITNYTGMCGIVRNSDPQATKIVPINHSIGEQIQCYSLWEYSRLKKVRFWDLIKMDVEMSEGPIIKALVIPPSRQISIEFHLHCGQTVQECGEIFYRLFGLGYEWIAGKEPTEQHAAGKNFWDTLWVL